MPAAAPFLVRLFLVHPRSPPRHRLQPSLPLVSFLRGAGSKGGEVLGLLLCCTVASATKVPFGPLFRRQRRAVSRVPNPRLRPSIVCSLRRPCAVRWNAPHGRCGFPDAVTFLFLCWFEKIVRQQKLPCITASQVHAVSETLSDSCGFFCILQGQAKLNPRQSERRAEKMFIKDKNKSVLMYL
ncbi:hypothetical protein BS78_08G027800 [Paspalum vaginatum]|nr:hypothetical protein BS78_08G027800 [Paspalum vaginatum]KAJ1264781.1 hypothetical protein BS78_08G027800 [Paspalum vaginatum]